MKCRYASNVAIYMYDGVKEPKLNEKFVIPSNKYVTSVCLLNPFLDLFRLIWTILPGNDVDDGLGGGAMIKPLLSCTVMHT